MPDAYEYFYGEGGVVERDRGFLNEITLRSVEYLYGYEPGWYLIVAAMRDRVTPADLSLRAYETAAHPKKFVTIDGG